MNVEEKNLRDSRDQIYILPQGQNNVWILRPQATHYVQLMTNVM